MQARHVVGCLASAVPYFVLSTTLVVVWMSPYSVANGEWVRYGVGLMLLEFILLHSGAFMGAFAMQQEQLARRVAIFAGLAAFYGLFAVGFSLALGTWSILEVYGFLMAGRFVTVIAASKGNVRELMTRSGAGVAFYLLAVFATLFLPLPELGITSAVRADVYPNAGGGEWERHPHLAIAAGALYFGLMGLFELFYMGKAPAAGATREER